MKYMGKQPEFDGVRNQPPFYTGVLTRSLRWKQVDTDATF